MPGLLPLLKNIFTKQPRFNDPAPARMIRHAHRTGTRRVCRAADYREHIEALAEEHGILIVWQENTRARAWRKPRRVRLSPVKTGATYAYALHEIGHIVGRQGPNRIEKELRAWEWARANAIEWTPTMQKTAARCLSSYIRWAERSKRAVKPDESHEIYRWIGA